MPETYPTIEAGWLRRPLLDTETLRSLALFASLDVEQAERILGSAHEHHAAAGEAVVEQWQVSRDLFVILIGTVEVSDDGNAVASLGPADFFGELAAIDWGAGFARTRSATFTATEPTRLLVLDWVLVNWLIKANSAVGDMLDQASQERLSNL